MGVLAWERWRQERREARGIELIDTLGGAPARRLAIFHIVCLGWVLFRSGSMATTLDVLSRLGDPGPVQLITPAVLLLIVGGLAVQYLPPDFRIPAQGEFREPAPGADGARARQLPPCARRIRT